MPMPMPGVWMVAVDVRGAVEMALELEKLMLRELGEAALGNGLEVL